jgi:uncharacterized protein (DUF433 family)
MDNELLLRIVTNPAVLVGKPVIRGLRISVDHILRALAAGIPEAELLKEHPELEIQDIRACLLYAARIVEDERVFPIPTA